MRNRRTFSVLLLSVVLNAGLLRAQQLTVQTESGTQTKLTRADIEALPHVELTSGGATFEGVNLRAVLEKGGIQFGDTLRGKRMASCLLVEAADGYRVVIALPEIDPAFSDKQFILAYLKDGKTLDAKEGPYRIVIPDEKRMARWVRQVARLRIVEVQ
jgi:hypothetical protein